MTTSQPTQPTRPSTGSRVDPMGLGIKMLHRLGGARGLDRLGLRRPAERAVFEATRAGFRTAGALTRTFATGGKSPQDPARLAATTFTGLFDLTPNEDQQMMVDVVTEFAAEVLRPAAADADTACEAP